MSPSSSVRGKYVDGGEGIALEVQARGQPGADFARDWGRGPDQYTGVRSASLSLNIGLRSVCRLADGNEQLFC